MGTVYTKSVYTIPVTGREAEIQVLTMLRRDSPSLDLKLCHSGYDD